VDGKPAPGDIPHSVLLVTRSDTRAGNLHFLKTTEVNNMLKIQVLRCVGAFRVTPRNKAYNAYLASSTAFLTETFVPPFRPSLCASEDWMATTSISAALGICFTTKRRSCLELCCMLHLSGLQASTPAANLAKPVPDINPEAKSNVFARDFTDVSVVALQVAAADFHARLESCTPSVTPSASKHSWPPPSASPTIAGPPAFWSITTSGSLRASPSPTRRRLLIVPSGL
jgi:hypothetical protein